MDKNPVYIPPAFSWNRFVCELLSWEGSRDLILGAVSQDVRFPDVSYYQKEIDWAILAASARAVIIRGGQGTWIDPKFKVNYLQAGMRGLLRGIYWFYDDRKSPKENFDTLATLLDEVGLPEMEIWVDWENTYNGQFGGIRNVVAFMELIEKTYSAARVGLYTGYYWFVDHSNPVTNFSQYQYLARHPLWLAWYTNDVTQVKIPAPWKVAPRLWQYGTPAIGKSMGVASAEIDMNLLTDPEYGIDQLYPVTFIGEKMIVNKTGKANTLAKVWALPGSAGGRVYPDVKAGQDVKVDQVVGSEVHLTSPVNGWSKGEWFNLTDVPVTDPGDMDPPPDNPPPTTPKPDFVITEVYTVEGYEPQTVVVILKPKP